MDHHRQSQSNQRVDRRSTWLPAPVSSGTARTARLAGSAAPIRGAKWSPLHGISRAGSGNFISSCPCFVQCGVPERVRQQLKRE